jgi:Holliday junction resolvase
MSEHNEQVIFCKYLDFKGLLYFAVPNGIFLKDKTTAFKIMAKMKAEGFKNGVPDLVVFMPKFILFIEMKTKTGTASEEQKNWIEKINKYFYAKAVVCKGFEEAKKIIEKEL